MKLQVPSNCFAQARARIQDTEFQGTEKVFFSSHLSKIPVNFWDIRVVSEQAGCLNERFAFLAFISVVGQLLLRKRFL